MTTTESTARPSRLMTNLLRSFGKPDSAAAPASAAGAHISIRMRLLLGLMALVVVLFGGSPDPVRAPGLFWMQAGQLGLLLVALALALVPGSRASATPLAAAVAIVVYALSAFSEVLLVGSPTPVLFTLLAVVSAAVLPWGLRVELATLGGAAAALLGAAALGEHPPSLSIASLGVLLAAVVAASSYIKELGERERRVAAERAEHLVRRQLRLAGRNDRMRIALRRDEIRRLEMEGELLDLGQALARELRQQLTAIGALASALGDGEQVGAPSEARELVRRIDEVGRDMRTAIGDLASLTGRHGAGGSRPGSKTVH